MTPSCSADDGACTATSRSKRTGGSRPVYLKQYGAQNLEFLSSWFVYLSLELCFSPSQLRPPGANPSRDGYWETQILTWMI
ncbi:hypothetical protein VTI28DRAFT_356 [Corynascus sepedonium]